MLAVMEALSKNDEKITKFFIKSEKGLDTLSQNVAILQAKISSLEVQVTPKNTMECKLEQQLSEEILETPKNFININVVAFHATKYLIRMLEFGNTLKSYTT